MTSSGQTILYMPNDRRKQLIWAHSRFAEQAKTRFLDQFNDISIETETEAAKTELFAELGNQFDHEVGDPSDVYETAKEWGYDHLILLKGMRDQALLSMISAFYSAFEKSLKGWIVGELTNIKWPLKSRQRVKQATAEELFDLLKAGKDNFRVTGAYRNLRNCCLVVNAYKFGDQHSFEQLLLYAPEFIGDDPHQEMDWNASLVFANGNYLKISNDDFDKFSDAIIEFWEGVPDYIRASQFSKLPEWLSDNSSS